MPTVLILGGGLQAISTARSLKESGYRVGIAAAHPDYSFKSSALDFKYVLPTPVTLNILIDIVRKEKIEVIIPMSDINAEFISRNKNKIAKETGCVAAVPDWKVFNTASDKLLLMDFCKLHGFPHPETFSCDTIDSESATTLKFPVLVKPNHSVGSRGIVKVTTPDELSSAINNVRKIYGDVHVQEYIEGNKPYFNVMIYRNSDGNILNCVILEIIRFYPLSGGSSAMCRTIENSTLSKLCAKILEEMGYAGFADFDILQDCEGNHKVIEINPRVPASLRGAAISGVNFPDIIVRDALKKQQNNYNYSPGKTMRYLGLDLMWFIASPSRFKSSPSWFNLLGKNIFYQEGGWADWKPMLSSLLGNLNKLEFKNGKIRKKSE